MQPQVACLPLAAHLMALWPRHRRTFFWRADFRGPAAPDGPPPCQRPCGYQRMHAWNHREPCCLPSCQGLAVRCSSSLRREAPHWRCWAAVRPSPTPCRPPRSAAHSSAAACSPLVPQHLQRQCLMMSRQISTGGNKADPYQQADSTAVGAIKVAHQMQRMLWLTKRCGWRAGGMCPGCCCQLCCLAI